jgi:hypothetical protein
MLRDTSGRKLAYGDCPRQLMAAPKAQGALRLCGGPTPDWSRQDNAQKKTRRTRRSDALSHLAEDGRV